MGCCNCCGSLSCNGLSNCNNNGRNQTNIYFTNVTGNVAIPFATDTTVLTLPVTTTSSLQPVKVDGVVQLQVVLQTAVAVVFQCGITIQLLRNGTPLITETYQLGGTLSLLATVTQTDVIPISFVDNNTSLGTNTYTVIVNFFQRTIGLGTITVTAQTRTLNAITF
ncbi:hypothetical protein COI93_18470 [Bacillus cereus]|uniref:Uncharacterized protein n=1 Tax=Bacillus cereus TaxID=1396 RepID=A0A2B0LWL6_BACCE|nr:hypothetical protein COI93_18470 [Bacillus cereus]